MRFQSLLSTVALSKPIFFNTGALKAYVQYAPFQNLFSSIVHLQSLFSPIRAFTIYILDRQKIGCCSERFSWLVQPTMMLLRLEGIFLSDPQARARLLASLLTLVRFHRFLGLCFFFLSSFFLAVYRCLMSLFLCFSVSVSVYVLLYFGLTLTVFFSFS
jgi:hypothetical protein